MNKVFDYNLLYRALYILNTKLRKNMQQYHKSYKGISISQIFLFSRSFLHALSKDLDTHCYAVNPPKVRQFKTGINWLFSSKYAQYNVHA